MTVAVGALWIAVDALEGDGELPLPPNDQTEAEAPSPEPSETPSSDEDQDKRDGSSKDDDNELITEGISVQVLNASSDEDADEALVGKLEELGYDIAAVNTYSIEDKTVVMWSSVESKEAAKALAEHFGWPAKAKIKELSSDVSVHVVIGKEGF